MAFKGESLSTKIVEIILELGNVGVRRTDLQSGDMFSKEKQGKGTMIGTGDDFK